MGVMADIIDLWTDGSGTSAQHPGGWAYVLTAAHPTTGEIHRQEGAGRSMSMSNNQAELTAVIEGLTAIRRPSSVTVHADSQYVIRAFNEGRISAWKAKEFRKIKNVPLWLELIEQADRHSVTWEWIPRSAHVENEDCDRRAGQQRRLAMRSLEP